MLVRIMQAARLLHYKTSKHRLDRRIEGGLLLIFWTVRLMRLVLRKYSLALGE